MLAWLLVVLSFTLDRWMQLSQGHPPPPLLVATADSALSTAKVELPTVTKKGLLNRHVKVLHAKAKVGDLEALNSMVGAILPFEQ